MFYCWSCGLARELPQTSKGNVYIMIMIEHFSKWVELVVLPDKSPHTISQAFCRNPSLRLMTKVRACKVAGQEESPRVTSHALDSAKECEGMNPHTPK
jgi:hypothetical protein